MAKTQLDFSGARGIIDPLQGLMSSVQQTNSNLGQMIVQDEAKQQHELTRIRQAKQDALATPGTPEWVAAKAAEQQAKIGGMTAEQAWKATNDPVYQNALAAAKRETPGTPEWTAAQDALQKSKISGLTAEMDFKKKNDPLFQAQINALNLAENERKGKEILANAIVGLPTEKTVSTTITPEQVEKVKTGLESAAVVDAGKVYNDEYTKLTTPTSAGTSYTLPGGEVIELTKPKSAMTPEEAHQKAMEKAKLLDVVAGKAPVIDESKLPKAGTKESKVKLTADELTQAKLDATINTVKQGKVPATVALEVISKITPTKTSKEKIDEAEYLLKEKEFQEKKASGYWKHNPGKGGGGTGELRKVLDEMYKDYGSPDLIGSGDQARIESKLASTQAAGYSDDEMKKAINASRGKYANPGGIGVSEDGFIEEVQRNLLRMK